MASTTTRAACSSLLVGPLVAVALSALAPACSSREATFAADPDAAAASEPSVAELSSRMASVVCESLRACCRTSTYEYDAKACTATVSPAFASYIDYEKSGSVRYYDSASVQACADAVAARMARCDSLPSTTLESLAAVARACAPTRHGTVTPGASCTLDVECAVPAGSYSASCVEDTTFDGGVTYSYPPSPRRKVCVQTKLLAGPGSACSLYTSTSVEFKATRCDPAHTYCRATNIAASDQIGTCTPYAALGDACVGTREKPVFCGPGAYCDLSTPNGACVAGKAAGTACKTGAECASEWCADSVFDPDAGVDQGRCVGPQPTAVANAWMVSPTSCAYGPRDLFSSSFGVFASR